MSDDERLDRLEAKIDQLADQLTALDKKLSNCIRLDADARLDIRLRLNKVEASMTDFREVERMAQEAYCLTHPKALAGVGEFIDLVNNASTRKT